MTIKQVFAGAKNKIVALDDFNRAHVMLFDESRGIYYWEKIYNSIQEYDLDIKILTEEK